MANVLPPQARTRLLRTMRARAIIVIGLALSMMAIVAILALLPAFITTAIARTGIASESGATTSAEQAEAARALALIKTLEPFATTTSPSTTLLEALALRPEGVVVTGIRYSAGKPASFILSGTSARREGVNSYKEILLSEGRFGEVSVPVAALVGTQEGRFSMTLSGI